MIEELAVGGLALWAGWVFIKDGFEKEDNI